MKTFLPPTVHGILDYIVGILTAVSPWLFGFVKLGGAALFLPLYIGCIEVLLSIFTNYKPGIIRVVPMSTHLVADTLLGFILMVSPFLYEFADKGVFLPHFLLGLMMMGSGIFTHSSPLLDNTSRNVKRDYGMSSTDAG
jgi:hypothetical protein